MSILHLCNVFLEEEAAGNLPSSLEKAFEAHPLFLSMQFLPLVYAPEEEALLVSQFPQEEVDHPLHLLSNPPKTGKVESWGYSPLIKQWADSHGLEYEMPPWEIVKKIQSKAFSFEKSPLPGGRLIYSIEEAETYLDQKIVFKSCFGYSGRGHLFPNNPKLKSYLEAEFSKNRPIIVEPWKERVFDFSSQWIIEKDQSFHCLGLTYLETTAYGTHKSNTVGDSQYEDYTEEHLQFVENVVKEIAQIGYFGNIGFDAMIYKEDEILKLQPIVEINARKTMGWVTLAYQKRKFPDQRITLALEDKKSGRGLLPDSVIKTKNLFCTQ